MTALLRKLTLWLNRLEVKIRLKTEQMNRYNERLKLEIEEQKRQKPYAKKMF